jgi:hypothetical protein
MHRDRSWGTPPPPPLTHHHTPTHPTQPTQPHSDEEIPAEFYNVGDGKPEVPSFVRQLFSVAYDQRTLTWGNLQAYREYCAKKAAVCESPTCLCLSRVHVYPGLPLVNPATHPLPHLRQRSAAKAARETALKMAEMEFMKAANVAEMEFMKAANAEMEATLVALRVAAVGQASDVATTARNAAYNTAYGETFREVMVIFKSMFDLNYDVDAAVAAVKKRYGTAAEAAAATNAN